MVYERANKELSLISDYTQVSWDAFAIAECQQLIRLAKQEDDGNLEDWTTNAIVPSEATGTAHIVARGTGVIAGLKVIELTIAHFGHAIECELLTTDGTSVKPNQKVATLTGSARGLLTLERVILNFIGRLSGVATLTRNFCAQVEGEKARIYDTRKTTPGWRRLEKYAVQCGGGRNHRTGLFDGILIKDNHLALTSGLTSNPKSTPAQAVQIARAFMLKAIEEKRLASPIPIEIEVDTIDQLTNVLSQHPDIILLDNMTLAQLNQAVELRDAEIAKRTPSISIDLEASGGVNLETVNKIAETGVDRISVGALTHSAINFDVALDWK